VKVHCDTVYCIDRSELGDTDTQRRSQTVSFSLWIILIFNTPLTFKETKVSELESI